MKARTHLKIGAYTADAATLNWGTLPRAGEPDIYEVLKREIKPWLDVPSDVGVSTAHEFQPHNSRSFAVFDTLAQNFARRCVDPLLDRYRTRQLQALNETTELPAISPREKQLNRWVLISLGSLGFAIAGHWLFAPLLIGAVIGGVYTTLGIYVEAYHSLVKQRKVNFALLAGLNTLGMWLGGFITPAIFGTAFYMVAVKVIAKTKDHSRQRLADVFGKQPRTVWVLVDGVEVETPLERIAAGDILAVQAGQAIPADGVITRGTATIDQHALTGEAQPVEKGVGESVLATTVVLTGAIHIRVEKAGHETTAAQITEMLNRTSSYQIEIESKAQQFADRAALPTLIVSAVALPTVGYQGAVAILGAGLGYDVALTGPISMLNYLNIASRHGVLVKDGRSLERLHEVDTIVFDKTGTLTLEDLHLAQVHSFNGFSEDALLAMAATAEARQSHPIARAIKSAAHARGLQLMPVDDMHYQVGFGMQVSVDGKTIRVGSARFMEMQEIPLHEEARELQRACAAQGCSLVFVAVDQQLMGALKLHATVRPEARQAVKRLRKRGLRLYMLSGDQLEPTRKLAEELGFDHYIANSLPEGKADVVELLHKEGRSVCFVGDGINDAIALKKAKVSISLLGATTVAMDTAQIVLMDRDLGHVANLLEMARDFDGTMKRALAAALIPDALVISGVFLLGFGVYASVASWVVGLTAGMWNAMLPMLKYRNGNALPEASE
jgi:Cu2+-exporting ATPase